MRFSEFRGKAITGRGVRGVAASPPPPVLARIPDCGLEHTIPHGDRDTKPKTQNPVQGYLAHEKQYLRRIPQ